MFPLRSKSDTQPVCPQSEVRRGSSFEPEKLTTDCRLVPEGGQGRTAAMVCGPKAFTDEMIDILHKVAYNPFVKSQLASHKLL